MSAVREFETPQEAAMRAAATVIRQIPDPRIPFNDITPGDLIRVGSDWVAVVDINDQSLLVRDDDDHLTTYPVNAGEKFLRWDGGF